ncbi:MAG TPA: chromosome segregation protein SMC [Candidatus Acidoferrales bacterium]|nr:chromosome segregation protein SMC [Candidatus Acidoferrales bacterium]
MRVSRLHLQGFKSFSGRAELELGPGITAIVGPNGSGKSNLVDAIRLVLGETSARELRGQRLDQVIFAGGANRAPVGMAEVSLVFDNEDGRLPVDDVEVAISRRVFRDGTSEFRRNGQRVRLRDLGRLLDATGLAQAGYAVIAQNDIESIIRASPAQRRHLIEEAAGVRGAQALIDDSSSRLRSLTEWLDGSIGRLAELLPRIESLREETVAAEEAAQLRGRLRELRGSLERGAWLAALAELRKLERQFQAGERRVAQLRERARQFQATYLVQREQLQAIEEGRLESERHAGALALAAQQSAAQVERWQERSVQAAESRAAAAQALAEARDDLQSLPGSGPGLAGEPSALEQGRTAISQVEQELTGLRQARALRQAELVSAQARDQEVERKVASARRRRAELEARLAGAEAWRNQALAARTAAEAMRVTAVSELQAVGDAAKALHQTAVKEAVGLERAQKAEAVRLQLVQRAEEGLSRATVSLREAEARLGAQVAAIEARTQAAPIAGAAAKGGARVRPLAEGVRATQAADAQAVEAGLGIFQLALVGEETAARRALGLAGDLAEIICWPVGEEPVVSNPPEGCRPLATTLVGDPGTLLVVARVSRLVCLAQDRQAAARWLARLPDGRAVLADGTVLGTGLEITPARAEGELRLVEQMRDAERTVQRQRAEFARAREALERAREAHNQQRELVDRMRQAATVAQAAANARQAEVDRLLGESSRSDQTIVGLQRELERREQQSAADRAALTTLEIELDREERALAGTSAAVESCRAEVASAEELMLEVGQRLEEARLTIAGVEAEARSWARRSEELTRRREQLLARDRSARERIQAAERSALEALQQLQLARHQATAAKTQFELSAEQRAQAQATSPDPLQGLGELERQRADLEAAVHSAAAQLEAWRRDVAGQTHQVERLQAAVTERPEPAVEAGESAPPDDPAKAAAEISKSERRLSALGPINELAPQQLTEILERTEGLRAAHDDCLQAKAELEAVLVQLQAVSGGRFQRTLLEVTREFESVWVELFGGGKATLTSTPGVDGAPGGVEMRVQPQGKRVLSMPLLSGGERALTALALVLALQKVSPSPFYVFDEVDAALDEANITHFADLLQRRAESSQFLVVTHNLTTMSRASMLYGVTQDGGGSSRILSVRLTSDGQSIEAEDETVLEPVGTGG